MNKDRGTEIKLRQEENKKLEEQTKRMEEELQKIRRLKQMENEKLKLEMEMKELDLNKEKEVKKSEPKNLRNYASNVAKKNSEKIEKKVKKQAKLAAMLEDSDEEGAIKSLPEDDGENVRYFLEVMGLEKYFMTLKTNKILTLEKLKAVKTEDLKKLDIPLKDMVAINKKLRNMGIN